MDNEIKKYIQTYLDNTFQYMGIKVKIEIENNENFYKVNLETENPGFLIGYQGKNLDALQRIVTVSARKQFNEAIKIRIEISNYRKKQEEQLQRKIKEIAQDVRNTKIEIRLDPMNSYQRRIVHETVKQFPELKSESFGENPSRYIVIKVKD